MPPESSERLHQPDNGQTSRINTRMDNPPSISSSSTLYSRPGRRKGAAFHEFLAGVSLYCACVFLPSLPRYIYLVYQEFKSSARAVGERLLWYIWVSWRFSILIMERWGWIADPLEKRREATYQDAVGSAGKRVRVRSFLKKFLSTSTAASLWEEFNQQEIRGAGGPTNTSLSSTAYTWGFGWSSSAYPAITMVLFDIQILTMLAVSLAIIRIWFVHMLVPEYLAPRRLEALTRCKSSHLLSSSSYKFSGEARLESAARQQRNGNEVNDGTTARWYDRLIAKVSIHWYRLRPTVRRALGHEPTALYNDLNTDVSPFRRSNYTPNPAQDLFSAPRYATAMFRFMYTSLSCVSAYYMFHSAIFWPREVFGSHPSASTKNCWDLSGSVVALGTLDEDYDNLNSELKYFFLAQAAYQLHSLCFHIVSMGLLLVYGEGSRGQSFGWFRKFFVARRRQFPPKFSQHSQQQMQQSESRRLMSMKTSMQSYIRPMLEHFVVLALLVSAYLFSGLRRLGSLGIFSLELSSVFLQLLQICIYAPEKSWLNKPKVIIFVHRFLTIPTFIYCRFFVLPFVVWHSAAFESQAWLDQIEKVFSKDWGQRIYSLFNGLLMLILSLNLVFFRRLLFHPHLKKFHWNDGAPQRKEGTRLRFNHEQL